MNGAYSGFLEGGLEGVLLHIGNKYPSVSITHAIHMNGAYDNMHLLLKYIQYDKYSWLVCRDVKLTALVFLQVAI
jgi:hypothetical protein